jgi:hypothetical protein
MDWPKEEARRTIIEGALSPLEETGGERSRPAEMRRTESKQSACRTASTIKDTTDSPRLRGLLNGNAGEDGDEARASILRAASRTEDPPDDDLRLMLLMSLAMLTGREAGCCWRCCWDEDEDEDKDELETAESGE